ncbi:MAG: insulinase family protein [Ignavibacteriae bacterium]|nr:insulinase family protein [Ignavibacteriota bacterium]MCB9242801.1 insulinase family protein [Ignavibacteriales bacterium]
MKTIKKQVYILPLLLIALLFGVVNVYSQGQEFDVDGVKVIYKPSVKDVISVRLFIDGGTANYPKDKEGIEALTLNLATTGGTKTMSKVEFNNELEKIGTSINSSTSFDFGNISMTCVSQYWDKSWDLFADAIMNPAFSDKEFQTVKDQLIAGANQTEANPDAHLLNMSMENVFKGKNYSKVPNGTVQSLQGITLQDAESYYKTIMVKKRIFLVVVGNMSKEDITSKIRNSLAGLPEGEAANVEDRVLINEPSEMIEDRDIETNYIRGVFSAPKMSEDDGVPMRLAMAILGDRYFVELRTKRSLSYAPSAFYSTGAIRNPYNVLYISTQKPKESMEVMVNILEDIKKNGFTEDELRNKKEMFATLYYMNLMTNNAQTQNLGTNEIISDWTLSEKFNDEIKNATLEQINEVFDKYTNIIKWTYLGDGTAVTKDDFKQIKKEENKDIQ